MPQRLRRLMDSRIEEELARNAGVLLVGPAGTDKLSCALGHAQSADLLDEESSPDSEVTIRFGKDFVEGVRIDPSVLLHGATPHLISGVDSVPAAQGEIESYVRALTEISMTGQVLMTSNYDLDHSLVKADEARRGYDAMRHPHGEGAISCLRMLPLSLQEQGLSSGDVSLSGLFDGELRSSSFELREHEDASRMGVIGATSGDLARMVCLGGWQTAGPTELTEAETRDQVREIVNSLVADAALRRGMSEDGATGCVWSLARCLDEIPTFEKIASGMEAATGSRPARDTVRRYLRELELSQVLLPVLGWTPPGRPRIRMRTKAKYYFVDPSIPAAALGASTEAVSDNPRLLLALLKNLVARDLHVYGESSGGCRICHYRDEHGLAADFVVERRMGGELNWGCIDVALSEATIDASSHDLCSIARKNGETPPAFLAVLTGRGVEARRREDGVWVIPITMLGV